MLKPWEYLFKTHILSRGWDYYENGAVSSLEKTETGYKATVEGSYDYEVEVEIYDNEVVDMFCDCPYAEDGNYCKHMAAVLYEIEEKSAQMTSEVRENPADIKTELENVIKNIDESEVRKLLLELALKDDSLQNQILTKYVDKISPSQMNRLKQEVEMIAWKYSDRRGYVDYYHAMDYVQDLEEFLDENVQNLIDKNLIMQAFELTNEVFHTVGNQDIDDSDGGTTWIANSCYEYWKQILDQATDEQRKQMFQWFKGRPQNYVIDYMEDYISDFLMDEFHDTSMLLEKLRMLDELIGRAGDKTDCGSLYSSYYGFENIILKRLQIMRELNYSENEINEYRTKFRHFSAIRELEVKEYLDRKEYDKAIEVLEESKKLDKEYAGLVSKYSEQLIQVYHKTGQQEEYKKELIYQVFSCRQDNLENVKLLKAECDEEEWCTYREQILNSNSCLGIKFSFLEFEELYDRLLKTIVESGSIYTLDQYEKVLKKKFPDIIRDTYVNYVRKHAESVCDRKAYKGLMTYLKKITKYPDGREKADQIAKEWKVIYRRRPAMMDELKKAGF